MYEITSKVKSKYGIHARPSAAITNEAKKFSGTDIVLINPDKKDEKIDARSIMSVMCLNRACGDLVIVRAYGGDERAAAEAVAKVIQEYEINED
jgi:phosphocarrier protein HPr